MFLNIFKQQISQLNSEGVGEIYTALNKMITKYFNAQKYILQF